MSEITRKSLLRSINENNKHLVESSGIDLLEKLVVYDYTRRWTVKQALNHPYFNEVRE